MACLSYQCQSVNKISVVMPVLLGNTVIFVYSLSVISEICYLYCWETSSFQTTSECLKFEIRVASKNQAIGRR